MVKSLEWHAPGWVHAVLSLFKVFLACGAYFYKVNVQIIYIVIYLGERESVIFKWGCKNLWCGHGNCECERNECEQNSQRHALA